MLTLNKKKLFFQKKVIILKIFITFLITSCDLNILKKNNNLLLNENNPNQFKKLIIPYENKEYKIPYTEKDLKKENIDIFPPV